MATIDIIIGIGIGFIVLLLVVLFLLPTEGRRKKKKRPQKGEQQKQRDWEGIAGRLETQTQTLRQEIIKFQKNQEDLAKRILVEKAKTKKLQEKLTQERGWQEKESSAGNKKAKEFKQLKEELVKLQESFGKEHVENLRFERECKEVKHTNENLVQQKKTLEAEQRNLETRIEEYRKQIVHLKKDNAILSKKQNDAMWVTKISYDRIARLLKEKEKELERVSRSTSDDK